MMNFATFFNPTNLKHKSVYSLLSIFESYRETKFTPLGTKYLQEAEPHLDQADSYNVRKGKKKDNLNARLRRYFFALQYSGIRQYFEKNNEQVAISWNARSDVRYIFMAAAQDAGAKTLFLELSPFPNAIAVDPKGINYLNSVPRNSSFYVNYQTDKGWEHLKDLMAPRVAHRTKVSALDLERESYIFVALQTEGDSQLVDFGGNYKNVSSYLKDICIASRCTGNRKVFVKEHPGSKISLADLAKDYSNVVIVNDIDTVDLIRNADLVATVNSSVGIESLILDKPVACSGMAFWDVDNLCYRPKNLDELKALFAQENFSLNTTLRDKFFAYLYNEYIIKLNWQANGVCRLPRSEIAKISNLLNISGNPKKLT